MNSLLDRNRRTNVYSELKEPEELAVNQMGMQLAVADTGINLIMK